MHGLITAQLRPCENGSEIFRQITFDEDLLAFTNELGTAATLTCWQREESCDMLLADRGLGWVLAGIVRKNLIHHNGQRRIVDLIMPGDFFVLRGGDTQHFSYDAATANTVTAVCSWRRLDAQAAASGLYQFFYNRACEAIARLEDHILVQGRTTAAEKVASYLLLMSERLHGDQRTPVVLPVSRYDIADHLGIAVETVSRAISELRRSGLITMAGPRQLAIRDPGRLQGPMRSERQRLRA